MRHFVLNPVITEALVLGVRHVVVRVDAGALALRGVRFALAWWSGSVDVVLAF